MKTWLRAVALALALLLTGVSASTTLAHNDKNGHQKGEVGDKDGHQKGDDN